MNCILLFRWLLLCMFCLSASEGFCIFIIKEPTNYAPSKKGINGSCNNSPAGITNPCQYSYESSNYVLAAVPRNGPIARLYCGEYTIDQFPNKRFWAADKYGRGSNGSMLDILTDNIQSDPAPLNKDPNFINSFKTKGGISLHLIGIAPVPRCHTRRILNRLHKLSKQSP